MCSKCLCFYVKKIVPVNMALSALGSSLKWCSINQANFTLLSIGFLHARAAYPVNLSIEVDACTCCHFPSKKILLLRQFLAKSSAITSMPFA
jgi:hypothetical protein